ncbi:MAG: NADH-quinone oxidoreductase subunit NuoE [Hyphomicrobiaceae bacterium]|nr:NADH-quinone oxidoreductase subunit NuoE [Hyphomicrobiaceae bacterium]
MSVRRLAEESVQPESFAFNAANAAWAEKRMALYPEGRQQSAVIPLLMRAQEQEGWVSRAAIEKVAEMLGMARIRVLEVATFYTQFQLQPVGTRAHVQVCGTTPCMLRGAEDLRAVCQRKIHQHPHEVNADGTLSWEEVECMGACVNAPMVAIGRDTYEDLTPGRLEEIIDAFAAGEGASVPAGPQNGRQFAMAITGATTLTDVPKRTSAKTAPARAATPEKAKPEPKVTDKAVNAEAKPAKAAELPKGQLFARPEGAPDDLKLISGVGPVLERKLNDFGVTRFDQIAAFKKADITALDDGLSFKGRIERDEWVKQAKALAKGVDEYVRVFGKQPK